MLDHIYLPEPWTFLTVLVFVILLAAGNYLVIWSQSRSPALLWMAASAALTGCGLGLWGLLPETPAIFLGIPTVLFGLGCLWTGCRRAGGRAPLWPGLAASLLGWPVIAFGTGLAADAESRAILSYACGTLLLGLALRAVMGRGWPRRPGHWFVTVLLAAEALLCALWTIGQALTRLGILALGPNVNAPFSALMLTGFSLVMSFAFVAWVKEDADSVHAAEASQDPLTGIGNRRRLNAELATAVEQARKRHHPLALIMIDIDQFKTYNDQYGHPAGDACLAAVATCLAETISHPEDEVMRYGGEEFTVLLRRADGAAALGLAERMRQAVRAMRRLHEGREEDIVTISLGVAAMPGATANPAILVAAADRALYRAKEQGRDRAVLFTAEETAGLTPDAVPLRLSEGLPQDARSPTVKI
ncbi:GGDEF domain-containing protein [Acidisoma sp. 7E03]